RRHLQATQPVPIVAPATQAPVLEFTDASGKIVGFELNKPLLTLGRADDNDIVVPDSVPDADTVSNHHAQIRREQEELVVVDLGSRNGLTVDGRHTNQNVLQDGDRIGFGSVEAVFRVALPGGSQGQRSAT
ncbi:MAG TPA: FHA domain-containing protein, partial [Anaerolineae bacterium]